MNVYPLNPILRPQIQSFDIDARTRSGGELAVTGREQVIGTGLGRWVANVQIRVHNQATVRAARALAWKMKGREHAVLMGPCDCSNASFAGNIITGIPYSQPGGILTLHSDGTGFSQGGQLPVVLATSAYRNTFVDIIVNDAVSLGEGIFMGFGDKLYGVVGVQTLSPTTKRIHVEPSLREAVTTATPIRLCDARCPMRAVSDDVARLELNLSRWGTFTLNMYEVY
jgi:hypothetical protein